MARLTIQPAVQDAILQMGEQVELQNSRGELIGYFLSPSTYRQLQLEIAKQLFTDEELAAARSQSGTRTTADVLRKLESLKKN
jgi:hypothetical protein